MIPSIEDFNLEGRRILIRCDLNVSLKDGRIIDDTRVQESLQTIRYALEHRAKVICCSHLGRPKGVINPGLSLMPIAEILSGQLNKDVIFPEDCIGDSVRKLVGDLRESQIILLENLRFHEGEEKNDPYFAQRLASLADIYINDAFGCSHRPHASIIGVVPFFKEAGVGLLMKQEIEALNNLIQNPRHPFYVVLGGSKVSDKMNVIDHLMHLVDGFLLGGGMAYTFLAAQRVKIGRSLVETDKIHQAEKILERCRMRGIKCLLPVDSILADEFKEHSSHRVVSNNQDWGSGMALDIGPATIELYKNTLQEAQTIFWNGPMGVYEWESFRHGTIQLAQAISVRSSLPPQAYTVAGGGDCLAAIKLARVSQGFSYLSTGGGAAMEFLDGRSLPGLRALEGRMRKESA